jgi:hypothetical protein
MQEHQAVQEPFLVSETIHSNRQGAHAGRPEQPSTPRLKMRDGNLTLDILLQDCEEGSHSMCPKKAEVHFTEEERSVMELPERCQAYLVCKCECHTTVRRTST